MVVLQSVTFRDNKEYNLHKILRAVELNVLLSKLTELDVCKNTERMVNEDRLKAFYKNY